MNILPPPRHRRRINTGRKDLQDLTRQCTEAPLEANAPPRIFWMGLSIAYRDTLAALCHCCRRLSSTPTRPASRVVHAKEFAL